MTHTVKGKHYKSMQFSKQATSATHHQRNTPLIQTPGLQFQLDSFLVLWRPGKSIFFMNSMHRRLAQALVQMTVVTSLIC